MDVSDPLDLDRHVALLGSHDWRIVEGASIALLCAGAAGVDAAIRGLASHDPRVRRGCADFMDHHGTDACVAALSDAALHDAVPTVRRAAVHALGCQRCKASPLGGDLVPLLIHVVLADTNNRVRSEAAYALGMRQTDARSVAALEYIVRHESHATLLREAHYALKRQSSAYRQTIDAQARAQSAARTSATCAVLPPPTSST